jgi:hypothetical protein
LPKKLQKKAEAWIHKDYDKFALAVFVVILITGILIKYGDGLFG